MKRLWSMCAATALAATVIASVPHAVADEVAWPGAAQLSAYDSAAALGEVLSTAVWTSSGVLAGAQRGSWPGRGAMVRFVGDSGWLQLSDAEKTAQAPKLAVDSAGVPWAMWWEQTDANPNTTVFRVAHFDAQLGWSQAESLSGQTSSPSPAFELLQGAQGPLSAVWGEFAGGGGEYPTVRRWDGTSWSAPIASAVKLNRLYFNVLADGTVVAIGNSSASGSPVLKAVTLASDASTWSDAFDMPAELIPGLTGNDYSGTVAAGSSVYVQFFDSTRSLVRFDGGTFTVDRVFKADSRDIDVPKLLGIGDSLFAVWLRFDDANWPLLWSQRDASGNWTSDTIITGTDNWDYKQYPQAVATSSGVVTVAWKAASVAVQYATVSSGGVWSEISTWPGTSSVYSLVSLVRSSADVPTILATSQVGNAYTGYALTPQAPGVPTGVVATGNAGAVDVSWAAPESGGPVSTYTARAYATDSSELVLGQCTAAAAETSCTIDGLNPHTVYYVSVAATNDSGSSAQSNPRASALTLPEVPVLAKSTVTASSVTFTFDSTDGVTYTASAMRGSVTIPEGQVGITANGSSRTVTVSGLAPNTRVTVRVTAANTSGSVTSLPSSSTTLTIVKPAKVTGVAAGRLTKGKVVLTWNRVPATGESVVYLYRWQKVGGAWGPWTQVSAPRATVSGWVKGSKYRVEVKARGATRGDGAASSTVTFTIS